MIKKINSNNRGFTLVEVLVSALIMGSIIVGLLQLFIYCSLLSEMSGNITIATSEAQSKMDEIRNTTFSLITTNYPSGTSFNLNQITGKGVIYIDSTTAPANSNLYRIKISVSWRNKNGRVIGSDKNLNGAIDAGEALDSDGNLDSLVKLVSYVANR